MIMFYQYWWHGFLWLITLYGIGDVLNSALTLLKAGWMDGWMEHLNTYSGVSIINIYFSVYAANAFLFFFFNITPHNMIHTWSESSESHLPHVYPFMFILSSATFIQGTALSFHRDIMHAVCYWMRNTSGSSRAHLSRKV